MVARLETFREQCAADIAIRNLQDIIELSNSGSKVIPMKNFSSWLRQIGSRLTMELQRFFAGRYGHDKLNMVILSAGLVLCVIGMFVQNVTVDMILTLGSYVMLIWSLVRCLSRNTYKRYQENRRFLLMLDRIKDKNNRYFSCPKCKQMVRVPKGKGKISITCPKCREKFIKKT